MVTHLDGIVSTHFTLNYTVKLRSVAAFGAAELCDEGTKRAALQTFVDDLVSGLWDYSRPPTAG